MPGDWRLYEPEVLDYWFKCKFCGQQMELVKDVSLVGAIVLNENEVYHCGTCHKDFERVPLSKMTADAVKYTWKFIRTINRMGL